MKKTLREGKGFNLDEATLANLLLAIAEGRIAQFVRSEFKQKPTKHFNEQWQFVQKTTVAKLKGSVPIKNGLHLTSHFIFILLTLCNNEVVIFLHIKNKEVR